MSKKSNSDAVYRKRVQSMYEVSMKRLEGRSIRISRSKQKNSMNNKAIEFIERLKLRASARTLGPGAVSNATTLL